MANEKPEGTDTIIEGAGVGADDDFDQASASFDAGRRDAITQPAHDTKAEPAAEPQSFTDRVDSLRGQAGDKARDFVAGAKDRATDGIDDVVRMIEDAAAEVDSKIGAQYGDYIRRASSSVAGFSDALKNKDVDTLFAEATELVRKSPGVAVGAAAAIGFVLARVARAGIADAPAGGDGAKAA